jgi:hypothetical protein
MHPSSVPPLDGVSPVLTIAASTWTSRRAVIASAALGTVTT